MATRRRSPGVSALVAITFLVMVVVNGLANALPLNGRLTGEVSDAYGNLFAPTGLTFAIWGVIYVLLACYTLYQLGLFRDPATRGHDALLSKVGIVFAVSSLANTVWIFTWHYDFITLSLLMMLVILVCLIVIATEVRKASLSARETFFIRVPFSVYFGWITVATIANVTVWLVSLGWDGFGIAEATWAVALIVIGALIGLAVILRNRDIGYGLVLAWAYLGIIIKHVGVDGFGGAYPAVIYAAGICIAAFVVGGIYTALSRRRSPAAIR